MEHQNNELDNRPDLNEIPNAVVELAESEFIAPTAAEQLSNVLTQLDFGEVLLKVVKGKIQTMSITKHYKMDKVKALPKIGELTNVDL